MGELVAALGGMAEPARRLLRVALHAGAGQVEQAERAGRRGVAGGGGTAVPARRLGVVRRQVAAAGIKVTDQRRRLRVAAECRAAQPGLAARGVALDPAPFHQRQSVARLARPHPPLRRLAIQLGGRGDVLLHPGAALGHHAEQVKGGAEAAFGRLGQAGGGLLLAFGVEGVAQLRQRHAEMALRAAGLGGTGIPTVGGVEVAHLRRPGGEDVAEQGLPVRRSGFRGARGPVRGALVVGLGVLLAGPGREHGAARAAAGDEPEQVQGREHHLRLDPAGLRGALDPARPFLPADRDPRPVEIGTSDPELRFRDPGGGGGAERCEGTTDLARLDQAEGVAQLALRREQGRRALLEEGRHQVLQHPWMWSGWMMKGRGGARGARRIRPAGPAMRQDGSRMPSVAGGITVLSRYCRMVRLPMLMSAVTAMPAVGLK